MASLTKVRINFLMTNFNNVLIKKCSNFNKIKRALFHCSAFLNGKGQEIKMPSLSPTMVEGKIVKWLKKEGDIINPGDVICDIETDKAVVSMEIEEEGILAKILVPENSPVIKVGSLIALMVGEGEDWKNVDVPSGIGVTASDSLSSSSSSSSSSPSSSSSSSSPSSSSSDSENDVKIDGPSTIPIKMPSLSPTMTSGTIVKWLKKEGDAISPGDVLCDIQTDKAVMSMETEEEGILAKIIVPDDSKDIEVGTLIALIVPEGEDWKNVKVPSSDHLSKSEKVSKPEPTSSIAEGDKDLESKNYGPAVKALLTVYQLEPGLIKPTGKNNRLLKEDVMKYIEINKLERKPVKPVSAPLSPSKTTAVSQTEKAPKKKTVPSIPVSKYRDIEVSNMRQIIAKRLLQSKKDIPHSYSLAKCEVTKIIKIKDMLFTEGVKVSINDLLTKATALALQLYPKANALYVNNEVKVLQNVDICVAVATDLGLYTPIIKSTNLKSVKTISEEIKQLSKKARDGKLKPEEYQGGTFTISNLGMFGITSFKAIINPPQSGILAVGGTRESLDPNLTIQKHITLSLSYDRRVLDECEATEFMETLKYVIENPKLIILDTGHNSSELGL